ncbi:polysaccharide deacetylase family protein [Pelotomaculum propionicicum]|uniref:Peptidoglycan-N-acetylglucosamine deacetylase n=1 Tax=Pelotomaculum propionicicum TaxID=258475 RepID=A0A4Y7RXR2_9FIRM|nr:polysaccharide deacetylase family protein [Pelotomaculum propionicicum]NLI12730.1 polysaccharide deacetylase [Peptococcaceae bacterium]TEB13462.1 Peptidoglycan-N-acetylglucosamine deacetylase [Pelotomaculum propionicicum]
MPYKLFFLLLIAASLLSGCGRVTTNAAATPDEPQSRTSASTTENEPAPAPPVPADPNKKVYLTFDDGPNSHYTGLVLDILKRYNVKATFVVIGSNVEKNPAVLQRILDEGHNLVNHTYSHDYKIIYASPQAFLADLEKCNNAIGKTGHEAKIYRAPGGPSKMEKSYYDYLSRYGYKSLEWNVSSADSDPRGVSPEQIINNVKNGVIQMEKAGRPPIILMHDGTEININVENPGAAVQNYIKSRESDIAALPVIIEFLQARGYTFAGVDANTPSAW